MEDIIKFAGQDYETAVVFPEADALLTTPCHSITRFVHGKILS